MAANKGRKLRKGGKKKTSADYIAELTSLVKKNSQSKKHKPIAVVFKRDPVTGERVYRSKYRARSTSGRTSTCTPFTEPSYSSNCVSDGNADEFDDNHINGFHDHNALNVGKTDTLTELLQNTEKFIQKFAKKKKTMSWKKRMTNVNVNWEFSRQRIYKVMLGMQAKLEKVCQLCKEKPAVVCCYQCSESVQNICGSCDLDKHKSLPFHDRQIFHSGYYGYVSPTTGITDDGVLMTIKKVVPTHDEPKTCSLCGATAGFHASLSGTRVIVITLRGRYELDVISKYKCLCCEAEFPYQITIENCIQGFFWPGTPTNICHLFHQDLLEYWDNLQKRMPGASERSFLLNLQDFSLSHGRAGTINIPTFNRAFKEWKFCIFELNKLQLKNWMECPACSLDQHSAHVDGNMKLYRFKSAGQRLRPCYYDETFIMSSDKVDEHIQHIYKDGKNCEANIGDSTCGDSNWRAAGNTGRKKAKLDETGLEIVGCRHSIAQAAVNMFHGEIYGYAHYLQKEKMVPRNVKFMWYDVICKYWPWLIKQDPTAASVMRPGLSVMHAKAHSWSCQVLWGGRWQESAAGTTGEEVEQINAHFSRLGNSTKHMRPEGREELLTEHAMTWNRWKIEQMPLILARRYLKVTKQAEILQTKVNSSLLDLGVNDGVSLVLSKWIDEVRLIAKEEEIFQKKINKLSDDEKAFLCDRLVSPPCCQTEKLLLRNAPKLFPRYFKSIASKDIVQIRTSAKDKLGQDWDASINHGKKLLEKQVLLFLEKTMQSLHFSICQTTININKIAGSSKQRTRLRRKITSFQTSLKVHVQDYNILKPSSELLVADVESGNFSWKPEQDIDGLIPTRVKKTVAEQEMERRRFNEEIDVVKKEMGNYLHYYKDIVIPNIEKELKSFTSQFLNVETRRNDIDVDVTDEDDQSSTAQTTYSYELWEPSCISGKVALLRRGLDYAFNQLSFGTDLFREIIDATTSEVLLEELELALSAEDDDDDDDGDDDDGGDDDDDGGGDYDDDGHDTEDETSNNDKLINNADVVSIEDILLDMESILKTSNSYAELDAVHPEAYDSQCMVWKLPYEVNQGSIAGRNGSSACSLIALVIGHLVHAFHVPDPVNGPLSIEWINLLVRSMELGNKIYDEFRENLPFRYLSTAEACEIMSGIFNLIPDSPLPLRLEDSHRQSTIAAQLESLLDNSEHRTAILTISDRCSVFILRPPSILYVDSHCHVPNGAVIVKGHQDNIHEFCQLVWTINDLQPQIYGNLVVVREA